MKRIAPRMHGQIGLIPCRRRQSEGRSQRAFWMGCVEVTSLQLSVITGKRELILCPAGSTKANVDADRGAMRALELSDATRRTMTQAAFGNNDHRINGRDLVAKQAPCEKATSSTGGLVTAATPPGCHRGPTQVQLLQWAQCPI